MPNRRFGFECELSSGAAPVIASLNQQRLAGMRTLHSYHCDCGDCRPNDVEADGGYLFRGQHDCTVSGEIITSILTHGADSAERAFTALSGTLLSQRAGVATNAGFHVHVDRTDMSTLDTLRLYRMFLRYQDSVAELASAKESAVRAYNSRVEIGTVAPNRCNQEGVYFDNFYLVGGAGNRPRNYTMCNGVEWREGMTAHCSYCASDIRLGYPQRVALAQDEWDRLYAAPAAPQQPTAAQRFWTDDTFEPFRPSKSYWLNGIGSGNATFEFRLWNATRVEWRMRLAVGVSVAMVDAAKAGVNVTENDERSLEEVIDPYLTDDTWAAILRQRSFKDAA